MNIRDLLELRIDIHTLTLTHIHSHTLTQTLDPTYWKCLSYLNYKEYLINDERKSANNRNHFLFPQANSGFFVHLNLLTLALSVNVCWSKLY